MNRLKQAALAAILCSVAFGFIEASGKNIIVTAGAKYALFVGILTLTNPGDEIIIPSPYWVSYPQMATLAGGVIKRLPTKSSENFKIKPYALREVISEKSKIAIKA